MTRIAVVDTKDIKLEYDEEHRTIWHTLHRYPGASALEAALEQGLDALRRHGAHKWLSDDRNGGALPKSHHEWAETDWGPRTAAAGWKYWALVPPTEIIGQMNMARLKETYSRLGVTVMVFRTPAEALVWLDRCGD